MSRRSPQKSAARTGGYGFVDNIGANVPPVPRVKTDTERGYIGAWMRRERLARGWKEAQVVAHLADLGQRIREDYYRQLEAGSGGKKPGPELQAALENIYGSQPLAPPPDTTGSTDLDAARVAGITALTEATQQQTAVLRELLEEIRADRSRMISPEALGIFLEQLHAEGLLAIPDTRPSMTGPEQQAPATRSAPQSHDV